MEGRAGRGWTGGRKTVRGRLKELSREMTGITAVQQGRKRKGSKKQEKGERLGLTDQGLRKRMTSRSLAWDTGPGGESVSLWGQVYTHAPFIEEKKYRKRRSKVCVGQGWRGGRISSIRATPNLTLQKQRPRTAPDMEETKGTKVNPQSLQKERHFSSLSFPQVHSN